MKILNMKKIKNRNILIVLAIVLILGFWGFSSSKCQGDECELSKMDGEIERTKDPILVKEKLENGEIILLDVREDFEWAEGHIDGAKHIPLVGLDKEAMKDFSKEELIYVYCRSGRRAGEAVLILEDLGFKNVFNMGGIIEWQERGGELVR